MRKIWLSVLKTLALFQLHHTHVSLPAYTYSCSCGGAWEGSYFVSASIRAMSFICKYGIVEWRCLIAHLFVYHALCREGLTTYTNCWYITPQFKIAGIVYISLPTVNSADGVEVFNGYSIEGVQDDIKKLCKSLLNLLEAAVWTSNRTGLVEKCCTFNNELLNIGCL